MGAQCLRGMSVAMRGIAIMAILLFVVADSQEEFGGANTGYGVEGTMGLGESGINRPKAESDKPKESGTPFPSRRTTAEKKAEDLESQLEDKPKVFKEPQSVSKVIAKIGTVTKPGPLVPQSSNEYAKIPHFVFKGTPEVVKNRRDCMKKCNGHDSCRSYSWNEQKKQCHWSTGSIRYGTFWTFYSKEYEYNAFGQWVPTNEYLPFKGMFAIDEDANMLTKEDKSVADCEEICSSDPKCKSFSYHEGSHACLFGISKVTFARGWNYYERNKAPKEVGGEYTLYPQRIDSYHRELRKREKTSLGIFAERDQKIRKKKLKKEKLMKVQNKETLLREKRLAKEMKRKE